jgi:nucleoside-diphosphate-sugar epimerase
VTGGAGYVGSTLVADLLAGGRAVRVLDSLAVGDGRSLLHFWADPRFEFVRGDVRDPDVGAAALENVDAVVHLAAVVGDPACKRDPERAREVNLEATRSLLAASRAAGVARFLFASTCSNYGKMEDGAGYVTEDWDLRPVSLYAETKVAAELDVLAASDERLATTCLRFATVYGTSPRMRFDLTVNEFTRDAFVNRELVVYGEQFWRPYIHVRDAARAIVTVLEAPSERVRGGVFNVGNTGENYRKQDLVQFLLERLPETRVERVPQADDPRDYRVSFDKITSLLGYETSRVVPDGLDEVIRLLGSDVIPDPFAPTFRN